MAKALFFFVAFFGLLPHALVSQELPSKFVLKHVNFSQPPRGDYGFRWEYPQPKGDLNRDGLPEYSAIGAYQNFAPSGQADAIAMLRMGGSGRLLWHKAYDQYSSFFSLPAAWRTSVLLNGVHGLTAVRVSADETHLGVFPEPIGSFVKWIPIPEPVPNAKNNWVTDVSLAGDVNQDGTDDFLYEGLGRDSNNDRFRVMGVFDGKRMEPMWLIVQNPTSELRTLLPYWAHRFPRFEDLNQDGFLDLLVNWIPTAGLLDAEIRAISGRDGSIIWQHFFPRPQYSAGGVVYIMPVGDLDGDGVRDVLGRTGADPSSSEPGYLRSISGATGVEIWEVTAEDYDPYYSTNPPEASWLGKIQPWPDVNGDGLDEFFSGATYVPNSTGGQDRQSWILDGATATVIQVIERSFVDLSPWSSVSVPSLADPTIWFDLDDDGWPEGTIDVNVDPGVAYPGAHQGIVGVESLRLPQNVNTGSPFSCKIHIPSSPGKDFHILFSQKFFSGVGAHHIAGWNTNIKLDATTQLLNGLAGAAGTLDSNGWYSGTMTLPPGVGLEGTTVYAKGVVFDPAKPGGVKTLTTLSTLIVQ